MTLIWVMSDKNFRILLLDRGFSSCDHMTSNFRLITSGIAEDGVRRQTTKLPGTKLRLVTTLNTIILIKVSMGYFSHDFTFWSVVI